MSSRLRVVAVFGLWLQVGCSDSVEMPPVKSTSPDSARASAQPAEKAALPSERVGLTPSLAVSSAISYELYPSNKIRLGQEYRLDKSEELDPRSSESTFPPWPKRENFTDRICIQDVGDKPGRIEGIGKTTGGTVTDSRHFLDLFQMPEVYFSDGGRKTIPEPVREFAAMFEGGERELTFGFAVSRDVGFLMISSPKYLCEKRENAIKHRYVEYIVFSAKLAVVTKLQFKNADDLKEFRRRFGEVNPFSEARGDARVQEISGFLKDRASLSINAIQLGGDSSATSSIIEQFKQRADRNDVREAKAAIDSIDKTWSESLKKDPVSDVDLGYWAIISLGIQAYR